MKAIYLLKKNIKSIKYQSSEIKRGKGQEITKLKKKQGDSTEARMIVVVGLMINRLYLISLYQIIVFTLNQHKLPIKIYLICNYPT